MVSYIGFSLKQNDTIFLLLSYMVIFPAYLIVLSKMKGMCKIGSYLYIYHEGNANSEFKWERRSAKYRDKNTNDIFSYIISSHTPFILVTIAVMILFFYTTEWKKIHTIYESMKFAIFVSLNIILYVIIYKNRNISTNNYIDKWDGIS